MVKNLSTSAGDTIAMGLIPGVIRFPGEENGNQFQYSYLEYSMGRGAWQVTGHGGRKELDVTEQLSIYTHTHTHTYLRISKKKNISDNSWLKRSMWV